MKKKPQPLHHSSSKVFMWEKILAVTLGTLFISVLLVSSILIPHPTDPQYATFKTVLALAASGFGAILPGMMHVELPLPKGILRATGALVLFVIVFFFTPISPSSSKARPEDVTQGISSGGTGTIHTGSGNIIIGYTVQDHERLLLEREDKVRKELQDLYAAKIELSELQRILKEKELTEIQLQLANINHSYQERIHFLENTVEVLRALQGNVNELQLNNALTALQKGETDQADALFEQIEMTAQPMIERAAKAAYERGKIKWEKLDYYGAFEHFQRAVERVPNELEYLISAAEAADALVELDLAVKWLEKAEQLLLTSNNNKELTVGTIRNYIGEAWREKGELDTAFEYYEKALENNLSIYGENHPDVAMVRNSLGLAWLDKGNPDTAISYFKIALATDLKTYGENHPDIAKIRNNLGIAWLEKKEFDKAIECFEQALANDLAAFGEQHPKVAIRRNNLGEAWLEKKDFDKAINYFELALASDLKTFGEGHPKIAIRLDNIGHAWRHKGQLDKAIGYFEQALASNLKTYGNDHPKIAIRLNHLGEAWLEKKEYDKSIKYFERSLAIEERKLGMDHPYTVLVRSNLENAKLAKSANPSR